MSSWCLVSEYPVVTEPAGRWVRRPFAPAPPPRGKASSTALPVPCPFHGVTSKSLTMLCASPHQLLGVCSVALGLDGEGDHRRAPRAGGDHSADWADGAHAPGPGETERRKWLSAALRDLVIYEEQLPRAIWTRNFRKHILCGGAGSVGALTRRREGMGRQAWGGGNSERTPAAESDTAGFFRLQTLWTGPSPREASVSLTLKWDGGYTCCAVETFKWTIASESTQPEALKEERWYH